MELKCFESESFIALSEVPGTKFLSARHQVFAPSFPRTKFSAP
jgi:hypothetical protein